MFRLRHDYFRIAGPIQAFWSRFGCLKLGRLNAKPSISEQPQLCATCLCGEEACNVDVHASAAALRESGGHRTVEWFKGVDSSSTRIRFLVHPNPVISFLGGLQDGRGAERKWACRARTLSRHPRSSFDPLIPELPATVTVQTRSDQ